MTNRKRMGLRELAAWVLVGALLVVVAAQTARAITSDRQNGRVVYDCATALQACNERCRNAGDVVLDFGNRIFECELSICRKNGWSPPSDWDAALEMYDATNAPEEQSNE